MLSFLVLVIPLIRISLTHPATIITMLGLIFLLSSLGQASAQIALPILADPKFRTIPGETLVRQQLSSWGIAVGPIDVSLHIRRDLTSQRVPHKGECRRSRRKVEARSGLNLNAGLGVGLGLQPSLSLGTSSSAEAGALTGSILGLGPPLGLGDKQGRGWGQADNVARGEKGDTEVSLISIPSSGHHPIYANILNLDRPDWENEL